MIIERFRSGLKTRTYRTTAPRCMGSNVSRDLRLAKAASFTAASDYENHLMDGDRTAAEMEQHRRTKQWIRKHGAWCASRINRPV